MRIIFLLIALLIPAGTASATDYQATVADGAATTLFLEVCETLRIDLGQAPGWSAARCATRLLYEGALCYNTSSTEVDATAVKTQSIRDASDRFVADWTTPAPQ